MAAGDRCGHRHRQDRVRDAVRGAGGRRGDALPGYSVCSSAGRRTEVEAAAAAAALGRRPQGRQVRNQLHAEPGRLAPAVDRRVHDAGADRRGLPLSQRLDGRAGAQRPGAGDVLDLRRRLQRRLELGGGLRRRGAREEGRHRRQSQLSCRAARFPHAPGTDEGVGAPVVGQLRPARSDRGAAMGAEQHRGVRRRSQPGDDLRAVRGRHLRGEPDALPARQGTLRPRHRAERSRAPREKRARRELLASATARPPVSSTPESKGAHSLAALRALPAAAFFTPTGGRRHAGSGRRRARRLGVDRQPRRPNRRL